MKASICIHTHQQYLTFFYCILNSGGTSIFFKSHSYPFYSFILPLPPTHLQFAILDMAIAISRDWTFKKKPNWWIRFISREELVLFGWRQFWWNWKLLSFIIDDDSFYRSSSSFFFLDDYTYLFYCYYLYVLLYGFFVDPEDAFVYFCAKTLVLPFKFFFFSVWLLFSYDIFKLYSVTIIYIK